MKNSISKLVEISPFDIYESNEEQWETRHTHKIPLHPEIVHHSKQEFVKALKRTIEVAGGTSSSAYTAKIIDEIFKF